MTSHRRSSDPLRSLSRLTGRDRLLLSWLAEHYVLTTGQITKALFPSLRSAQLRLKTLHGIGAVARFAFARSDTDPGRCHYTLGPLGLALHPDTYTDPDHPGARAPRSYLERGLRIARSPRLAHLLGVNQFFIDLYAVTRRDPTARLSRWWSEQHATAAYESARIRPDGHGIWRAAGRTVGFFLEHDNATEDRTRVIRKLAAYERLTTRGPTYPVLLWVPDTRREHSLLQVLAGVATRCPVATAVHGDDPAAAVWTLAAAPGRRLPLHKLPSDHGPHTDTNPHRFDDPDPDRR